MKDTASLYPKFSRNLAISSASMPVLSAIVASSSTSNKFRAIDDFQIGDDAHACIEQAIEEVDQDFVARIRAEYLLKGQVGLGIMD